MTDHSPIDPADEGAGLRSLERPASDRLQDGKSGEKPPAEKAKKKRAWLTNPRELLNTILSLNDEPHSIALGAAIGMCIGLTPFMGLQMITVMVIAFLTRPFLYFNRVAAIIMVYVSNPLTMVPLYWGEYRLGAMIVGGSATREDFVRLADFEGAAEWWQNFQALLVGIGAPLLIGSAIVAVIGGVLWYPVMYWLLIRFRTREATVSAPPEEAVPSLDEGTGQPL